MPSDGPEDSGARLGAAERLTVSLLATVLADLLHIRSQTGMSKTDIINRSITLYRFVHDQLRSGKELAVRDPKTGKEQIVQFF